jgi:hypothetical protein
MAGRYFPYHRLLPLLAFTALGALAFILVVFRAHYTADVLTALYVTAGGWFLLQPYERRDLNRYGIRANVLIRPNYMSVGTDPWRAREIMAGFEEAEFEEEAAEAMGSGVGGGGGRGEGAAATTRAMEEGKVGASPGARGEGEEEEEEGTSAREAEEETAAIEERAGVGAGCVGLCRRCRARMSGGLGEGDGGSGGRPSTRRRRRKKKPVTYLPPLPPSCPPLVEHADLTESARAFERLPW